MVKGRFDLDLRDEAFDILNTAKHYLISPITAAIGGEVTWDDTHLDRYKRTVTDVSDIVLEQPDGPIDRALLEWVVSEFAGAHSLHAKEVTASFWGERTTLTANSAKRFARLPALDPVPPASIQCVTCSTGFPGRPMTHSFTVFIEERVQRRPLAATQPRGTAVQQVEQSQAYRA